MEDQALIHASTMELARLDSQGMAIPVELGVAQALSLVGALQLACRHPGFSGPSRELMGALVDSIQALFEEAGSNALVELIQRGWDPQYDVSNGSGG